MRKIYTVLVNWNGWQDTIECLESVFRNDYPNYQVIVCDNGSTDGSIDLIQKWALGEINVSVAPESRFKNLTQLPIQKPIQFVCYDQEVAGQGSGLDVAIPLILIRSNINLGYAGGNNVALRYVLSRVEASYVWLLNNDTVVDPGALTALVERMEKQAEAGMCGSMIPYYNQPDTIWAQGGGTFNRWLAKSHCIGNGLPLKRQIAPVDVERRMAYVAGASLLVSRRFLEEVGLMSEDYFLYFEEPDWAFRAKGKFKLAYSSNSIVYHKVGVSTQLINKAEHGFGSPYDFVFRSSLRFTQTFFPIALPLVFTRCIINRLRVWIGSLVHRARSQS